MLGSAVAENNSKGDLWITLYVPNISGIKYICRMCSSIIIARQFRKHLEYPFTIQHKWSLK